MRCNLQLQIFWLTIISRPSKCSTPEVNLLLLLVQCTSAATINSLTLPFYIVQVSPNGNQNCCVTSCLSFEYPWPDGHVCSLT